MLKRSLEPLRRQARRGLAVALVAALYLATRLPAPAEWKRAAAAARFHFTALPLPEPSGARAPRTVREVHPSLRKISAWISSVGAGVALGDLDGDGLPNDLCLVDPRTDTVLVAPVPGTGARFPSVELEPTGLRHDPRTMAPMGCLLGDLDEDGATDVLVYYWGRTPVVFFRRGGGYVPFAPVAGEERWFSNAATLADLDGDGHTDLVVANYFPDGARILDARASGSEHMQASMSRAYNGGDTHLLLWKSASAGAQPAVYFEDLRNVLDEEVAHAWTLAVAAADLDGDLLPELYFANDFGPDRLLHNRSSRGQLRFASLRGARSPQTPASKVLGRDSFKGMGVEVGDLDGDGVLDILVSNIATPYGLLESHFAFIGSGEVAAMRRGRAPFSDESEALGLSRSGWAWDVKLADLDNDSIPEVLQATGFVRGSVNRWPELQELATANDGLLAHVAAWPRFAPGDDLSGHRALPFFVRIGARYVDLAREVGLSQQHVTRGIAVADIDGDGDLDYALANQWERSLLLRNDCPGCGRFLGLHLRLPLQLGAVERTAARPGHPDRLVPSRPAIGARAVVHLPDGRRLLAQVDGGNGHSGKRSPELHFGIGAVSPEQLLRVELWYRDPDGVVRQDTLQLRPGWHTVDLAWPAEKRASR